MKTNARIIRYRKTLQRLLTADSVIVGMALNFSIGTRHMELKLGNRLKARREDPTVGLLGASSLLIITNYYTAASSAASIRSFSRKTVTPSNIAPPALQTARTPRLSASIKAIGSPPL